MYPEKIDQVFTAITTLGTGIVYRVCCMCYHFPPPALGFYLSAFLSFVLFFCTVVVFDVYM
jgi:hypothetical protein